MSEERRAVTPIRPAAAYIGGKRENVEGVELHLVIVLARMEGVNYRSSSTFAAKLGYRPIL